jgi:hypothetical protein
MLALPAEFVLLPHSTLSSSDSSSSTRGKSIVSQSAVDSAIGCRLSSRSTSFQSWVVVVHSRRTWAFQPLSDEPACLDCGFSECPSVVGLRSYRARLFIFSRTSSGTNASSPQYQICLSLISHLPQPPHFSATNLPPLPLIPPLVHHHIR